MEVRLRNARQSDLPVLEEMLYEAVFWRAGPKRPTFEEGLAYPEVSRSLANWGEREGDTAVVATVDSVPAGAAWYRYWTDDNYISGYIDETMPVLVIAVRSDYRHQGIGGKMVEWLIDQAAKGAIHKISLNVSKDNYALNLYRQQGFVVHADKGDAFLMVREI